MKKYLLYIRFQSTSLDMFIQLMGISEAKDYNEMQLFQQEIVASIFRMGFTVTISHFIVYNEEQRDSFLNFLSLTNGVCNFQLYFIKDPNQELNVWDNLIENLKKDADGIALIGNKYSQNIICKNLSSFDQKNIEIPSFLNFDVIIPK